MYENINFYKIIKYPNTKIIHSGIYFENVIIDYKKKNFKYKSFIPLEIKLKNFKEPIYEFQINEPLDKRNLINRFERGSIAMVKIDDKNSSSTEFFFTLNNSPELDGRYSIFGKLISGYEILNRITKEDFIKSIEISH